MFNYLKKNEKNGNELPRRKQWGSSLHLQHKANYAASGGEFTPQRLIKARELQNKY